MSLSRRLLIEFLFYTVVFCLEQDKDNAVSTDFIGSEGFRRNIVFDPISTLRKITPAGSVQSEKVSVQFYYECLCPYCVEFSTTSFEPAVQLLSPYLNIQTYPYGNAKTSRSNGKYKFKCQHGPEECYGNKLHACALDLLKNKTQALLFNTCMMKPRQDTYGSDDKAADACGKEQGINAAPIKKCAKGSRGNKLLKYYGDQSKKVNITYVPYILINGKPNDGSNFINDVRAAFNDPPPPCSDEETAF